MKQQIKNRLLAVSSCSDPCGESKHILHTFSDANLKPSVISLELEKTFGGSSCLHIKL